MNKKIKLISSDLDGTLLFRPKLQKEKIITEKNFAAIENYTKNNNLIILATGRNISTTEKYAEQIESYANKKIIPYLICLNGAIIFDNQKKQVIDYTSFDQHLILKLIHFLKENNIRFFMQKIEKDNSKNKRQIYISSNKIIFKNLMKNYFKNTEIITLKNEKDAFDIGKITLVSFKSIGLKWKKKLQAEFPELNYFLYTNYMVEIAPPNTSKLSALKKVSQKLNIPLDEIAAIGDEENDFLAISHSGFGVLVDPEDDKHAKIIEKAKFITTNKIGEAVANAIEELEKRNLIFYEQN